MSPFSTARLLPNRSRQEEADIWQRLGYGAAEELLVVDSRSLVRPGQQVENRVVALLKTMLLPVSHARLQALVRGRTHC